MLNGIKILKHTLASGIVGNLYYAQAYHIWHFITTEPLIWVYLSALLAYYFILYMYEAKLIGLSDQYYSLYRWSKITVIIINVFFSLWEYFTQGFCQEPIPVIIFRVLIFLFIALFPEVILPLIFNIRQAET